MKNFFQSVIKQDQGVLSFEWILLITLLAIGIVAGIAGVRDAIISEMGDVSQATIAIDQSFKMKGDPKLGIPTVKFKDKKSFFSDQGRTKSPKGQGTERDIDS